VLAGPTDDGVERLRAYGWNPEAVRQVAENRAAEERAQVARLNADPKWRRGRLRNVVMAREVIIELFDALNEALEARGCDFSDVWTDREAAREIPSTMPSTDVAVTLKTAAHRNPQKGWLRNDIYDIDALSVAVLYCDIVVTEKHAHHVLQAERAPSRMDTVLLYRLGDLPRHSEICAESSWSRSEQRWTPLALNGVLLLRRPLARRINSFRELKRHVLCVIDHVPDDEDGRGCLEVELTQLVR
jgi:hypothetical protein